jgi:uncharacterized membrane protein
MLVLLGSGMGLLASFMLSLEAYWRALNPTQVFSCDVNAKLSCSSVAASWQSTLLHWPGGGAIPNAFLGLGIFAVFVTIGVFIASHATIPEWILWGFRLGVVAELVFSTWLLWESMFVIGAMCPWCLTMDLGSILLAFGAFRDWALAKGDRHPRALRFTIGMESLLVSVLILLAFAFIVVLHYFGSI